MGCRLFVGFVIGKVVIVVGIGVVVWRENFCLICTKKRKEQLGLFEKGQKSGDPTQLLQGGHSDMTGKYRLK
jgi:hypothetical protein